MTVTTPTGNVKGSDLSTLRDAYTGHWSGILCPVGAAMAQWQLAILLSDAADACGSGSPFVPNEVMLRLVVVGYNELPDCAPVYPSSGLPIALRVPVVNADTVDGVHLVCRAYFNQARSNGGAGSDVEATGGAVTLTRMDSTAFEGSYTLTFPNGGAAAGSFAAPWCGPPAPSS